MIHKFLLTLFIANFGFISVLAPKASAQERPECYLIDESGELTDLTDICNVSQKRSPEPATTEGENIVNNNNNINIVSSDAVKTGVLSDDGFVIDGNNYSEDSGSINSSYYIDNEPGINYTAYVRRYTASPNSFVRQTRREEIFQFDRPLSHTGILRRGRNELPFIIYRYQI